jgi:hypothetical protein
MPVTRSSVLGAKDIEAAQTLIRFHYEVSKTIPVAKPARYEHNMSLRGRKNVSGSRPKRQCSVYTPGMYAEDP